MISKVNMDNIDVKDIEKKNYCHTDIPLYNLHDKCEERWVKAIEWLSNCDLNKLELSDLTSMIERMVKENFEEKKKENKKKDGNKFWSNNLIPREIRTLFKK